MKRALGILVLLAGVCGPATGQVTRAQTPVTVRGQVFVPSGGPLQIQIRLLLNEEGGLRPPEYFFTDSNGRFQISGLTQSAGYTLTIESDGKNWATTIENFYVMGTRPFVTIRLRPLEKQPGPKEPSVTVAELSQSIPRAARKEFEAAMDLALQGEHDRARGKLERAVALYPDFVAARNELAVELMRVRRLPEAEAHLRHALEVDAAAPRPLLNLGLCLYRQERFADALPFLERGAQLDPANANAHLLYGITLVMTGDDARAEPVLRKAYEQGGKRYAKALLYLSRLYARRRDYPRAAEALEIYLSDVPDAPDAKALGATLAKLREAVKQ